jgi:CRISPR-associated protein Cas2
MEISPGVFVGRLPQRVRDEVWERIVELCKDGRAIMIESARNEQRMTFRVHRHDWELVDHDGLLLMQRPSAPKGRYTGMRKGWSNASRWRRTGPKAPK